MKIKGYWTFEKCKEVALLFKNRMDFYNSQKVAYVTASKRGWLKEICKHMEYNQTPPGTWSYENCKKEAEKYKNKSEFQKYNYNAYRRAYENGWLDEICLHMNPKGNLFKRLVYVYIFEDKHFYVGLTCDNNRRKIEHITTKTSVSKHINETKSNFEYKELSEYLDVDEAIKQEKYFLDKFIEEGLIPLNRNKTGGLGGGIKKWNYETCKSAASRCRGRYEFSRKYGRAYKECVTNDWLVEFFPEKLSSFSQ